MNTESMNTGGNEAPYSILNLFRIEIVNQADLLEKEISSVKKGELISLEKYNSLRRIAHSIKGTARIVSIDPILQLAQALETCFLAAKDGKIALGVDFCNSIDKTIKLLKSFEYVHEAEVVNYTTKPDFLLLTNEFLSFLSSQFPNLTESTSSSISTSQSTSLPQPEKKIPIIQKQEPQKEIEKKIQPTTIVEDKPKQELHESQTSGSYKEGRDKISLERDRILRVTAKILNQLMGLAGEFLVESRWLQPFTEELHRLKKKQYEVMLTIDNLRAGLNELPSDEETNEYLKELQDGMNKCQRGLSERINEIEMFMRRHISHSDRLYNEVIACRMRPFAEGVEGFPHFVKDMSSQLGKKVNLVIFGKSTPVDREIIEKLKTPLNHLIRNAIDHGIESPEERTAKGKPPEGTITLRARHVSGMLFISVSDDGRGIDIEELRKLLIHKKLVSSKEALTLTQADVLAFLFQPGFTTAKTVTELSGRGVGLNIVQEMLHEVGGEIRVFTEKGKGIEFQLLLPLTLSVIRSLVVDIAGEPYGFPVGRIDHTLIIQKKDINIIENKKYIEHEGKNIGIFFAKQILDLTEDSSESDSLSVVVFNYHSNVYGVVVDSFVGEKELVVAEVDQRLGKIPNISTGSFLEDGSPILIIDIDDLAKSADAILSGKKTESLSRVKSKQKAVSTKTKKILIVDDSLTVREVNSRLLKNMGYSVDTAVDGLDGWNTLKAGEYDLLVTDVDMPHMDGIELIRMIRQDPRLYRLPIIIVSYKEREDDRIIGLEAGANTYITKGSFQDQRFINAVQDLIDKEGN